MAKKQLSLYLDPDDSIEELIINHLIGLGSGRQQFIREICRLGFMSREAGLLIHKGELKYESGFTIVTKPIPTAAPVRLGASSVLATLAVAPVQEV